jgi:nicotinate phosphoribosyltransferase
MRDEKMAQGFVVLSEKIQLIEESDYDFILVDFGTRRRFSKKWHNSVVDLLDERIPESFIGTSNVYLAREYDLKPIGTMAHEFISAGQSFVHPLDSQSYMLHKWADE